MKLAAIFNIWEDNIEMLISAIRAMPADYFIYVWSTKSNRGNEPKNPYYWDITFYGLSSFQAERSHFIQCEPVNLSDPHDSEIRKRNIGIEKAKELGCTHFIMMDSDEFYHPLEFIETKEWIDQTGINGVVHPIKVYVGKPTLWCEDHTLVPGIQKLIPDLQMGSFKKYPFAYDDHGNAHIDPTRRTNVMTGIEISPYHMHHMSYVRRDIDLKINNSSANLRRSADKIKRDIANAAPGYMSEIYHQELKECPNYFDIHI